MNEDASDKKRVFSKGYKFGKGYIYYFRRFLKKYIEDIKSSRQTNTKRNKR